MHTHNYVVFPKRGALRWLSVTGEFNGSNAKMTHTKFERHQLDGAMNLIWTVGAFLYCNCVLLKSF